MRTVRLLETHSDVLTAQVRAIQDTHQRPAHEALQHWGAWSRVAGGTTSGDRPTVTAPKMNRQCTPGTEPAAPVPFVMDNAMRTRQYNVHCIPEPDELDEYADARKGEDVDVVLGLPGFKPEWRAILRAIYVDKLPPHQWTRAAKVKEHRFVTEFSEALNYLRQRLG